MSDAPLFPDEIEALLSRTGTKAGRLQRHCYAVYLEHVRAGALPTSGRFIFYELEDRGIVPKRYYDEDGNERKRTPAQDISDALTHLREVSLVPWEDLVDETRTLDEWAYRATVSAYVLDAVEEARIDAWAGAKPPLIICESRSLAGVLRLIAQAYLCPIASTNGQTRGFLHRNVAPLVKGRRRVLYLGDYDLSGAHIEDNTRKVLSEYGELEWERVAITGVQVREGGYEADAVEKVDRRFKPAYHYRAVETERIGQVPLTRLLRARLDAELPERLADVLEREEEQRVQVREALADLLGEDGE
jgi:hypothetical protein